MSYTIYTTPAYILEKYETGEHDITLLLMTRDHGLLYVRATGVRKGTSKMRMHIHTWSHVSVSLVQGRLWRLTGIETLQTYDFIKNYTVTSVMVKIIHTVKLLHSGEHHGVFEYELFDRLVQTSMHVEDGDMSAFEIWSMIQILAVYGYWDEQVFSSQSSFDSNTVFYINGIQKVLIQAINRSLAATQLVS